VLEHRVDGVDTFRGVTACLLAALVLTLATPDAIAASTRQCSDPCLQAGRAELRECTSSAAGAFADALSGCLERDRKCVDACRAGRQDCRDETTVGSDLLTCRLELAAAKETCRSSFPIGSNRRAICIDRAEIAGFRCRRTAFQRVRRELRTCRSDFDQCAGACAPGAPSSGDEACRAAGRAAFRDVVARCRTVHKATASACINKDVACVLACDEERSDCNAPTRTALDAAIATCSTQRAADLAACAGTPDHQACVDTAQANALACREAALTVSEPGFAACAAQYVSCLRTCPAGGG
jgi:hypothetical protein